MAYFDMSVPTTAANNSPNALKFMIVTGTAAATPSDPSGSTIQAAVGVGNPWIYLARIRIGTPGSYVAPSTITDSMIDDLRQPISFKGRLWGGSNNTNGHLVPNVADDTVALLGANQTFTGSKTFAGPVTLPNSSAVARVGTSETTTSTSPADLATTTDSVTITIGANGIAMVKIGAQLSNNTADSINTITFAASGANTIAAATYKAFMQTSGANRLYKISETFLIPGLTPGSTTFKMKYQVGNGGGGSGTMTASDREIWAMPL